MDLRCHLLTYSRGVSFGRLKNLELIVYLVSPVSNLSAYLNFIQQVIQGNRPLLNSVNASHS